MPSIRLKNESDRPSLFGAFQESGGLVHFYYPDGPTKKGAYYVPDVLLKILKKNKIGFELVKWGKSNAKD